LLHPAADHEVRRVSLARRQHHPEVALSLLASSPRRSHTLRRIPLVSSRTASPRPLPSCRLHSLRTSLSQRLTPLRPPHSRGPVRLPPQANLAQGTSRSAGAARSVVLPLPARAARARSDLPLVPPEQVVGWVTPLPLRTEARSGSGCRPPGRARRLGLTLATGFVRRVSPSPEAGASWSAHAQLLARRSGLAGWRLHTVSRRRRQRGARSSRLGLR
jgi:hypothetical protein